MPKQEKKENGTTLWVSIEAANEFNRLRKELEKIFDKSISQDKLLRFLMFAKVDWSDLLIMNSEKGTIGDFKDLVDA